jgi:guanine deaminase
MEFQKKMMLKAIDLAIENISHTDGGPFGAVIVREGEILGNGVNRVVCEHDPTSHAEIIAIKVACRALGSHNLTGSDLFTSCYPCPMCLGAIRWARIERVFYALTSRDAADMGFADEEFYRMHGIPEDLSHLTMIQIASEEALRIKDAWLSKQSRKMY